MRKLGVTSAVAFVMTVWAANWAITRYGFVSVGFGLSAPAGVFFAGLAFTLRDIVHRSLGRYAVTVAILVGCGFSYLISPSFAAASAVAFLLSESADLFVYTPLERKSLVGAVVASNTVGAVVDSLLFLYIAFGSINFWQGQVVGKLEMTALALPLVVLLRRVGRTVAA